MVELQIILYKLIKLKKFIIYVTCLYQFVVSVKEID